jgi:hypothetical protein
LWRLEEENRRLKQCVADLSLDQEARKATVQKKLEGAGLRADAGFAMEQLGLSARQGLSARRVRPQQLSL